MPGGEAFNALLQQFTETLRCEHQREVDSLKSQITDLASQLHTLQESPSVWESSDGADGPVSAEVQVAMTSSMSSRTSTIVAMMSDASNAMRARAIDNIFFRDFRAAKRDRGTGTAPSKPRAIGLVEDVVFSRGFEASVALLIVLSVIVTCLESQYAGAQIGAGLGYEADSLFQGWSSGQVYFAKTDWLCGILFTAELLLRMVALRTRCCRDPWLWADAFIVALWVISFVDYGFPLNGAVMRLCRLGKLVRLIRPFRNIKSFYALMLLSTSVASSSVILMWTAVLLFLVLLLNSMVLHQFLVNYYFENDAFPLAERKELYRYFGLVSTSLFSMFEVTLGNWPPLSRMLYEYVSAWFILITIFHKLAVGFAFVGIVNGVFMQETFKVTKHNNELVLRQGLLASDAHAKKMKKLIRAVCPSNDTKLDVDDFQAMFKSDEMRTWLRIMEFAPQDTAALFRMMADEHGDLTVEGLIKGVERFKGPASNIDLQILMHEHRRLRGVVDGLGKSAQDEVQMNRP